MITYAALIAGVVCIILLTAAIVQQKRLYRAVKLNQRLTESIDRMAEMLRLAEKNQDFSVRCQNPSLERCWELKQCENYECCAYENENRRCWQLTGTLCRDPGNDDSVFDRAKKCERCEVYQNACSDVVYRLTEQFNNVLATLQEKSEMVTEAKRSVQRASKLASIGEFAAGLAHEINNPLDGVMSCLARLERDPANLSQNLEYLRMIRDALKRMGLSVQRLLEYSRKHELQRESLDIHTVIENVVALIEMSARQKAISLEFEFEDSIPPVMGDKYFLIQALLNLSLNAITATENRSARIAMAAGRSESLSATEPGKITFRTRVDGMLNDKGPCVEVDVVDNGAGIDPAVLKRVYEPFFSTKDPGKGTGLGLTIVKGIIEEHHGEIVIESVPGKGTVVRVFLPTFDEDAVVPLNAEEALHT